MEKKMNQQKQDRRIIRTKKLLENALLKLLKRKSIHKISIKELADEADITRATFYQHYRNPYEILEIMQNRILNEIQNIILDTTGGDSYGFFIQLFKYLANEDVNAEVLAFDAGNGTGYERIGKTIHKDYMLRWNNYLSSFQSTTYNYYRYYIIFGCISVVENWINSGKVETPEQMATITNNMLPQEKMYLKITP